MNNNNDDIKAGLEVAKDVTNTLFDLQILLNGDLSAKNKVIIVSAKIKIALKSVERKLGVSNE